MALNETPGTHVVVKRCPLEQRTIAVPADLVASSTCYHGLSDKEGGYSDQNDKNE
jgi:hypothetical protein